MHAGSQLAPRVKLFFLIIIFLKIFHVGRMYFFEENYQKTKRGGYYDWFFSLILFIILYGSGQSIFCLC